MPEKAQSMFPKIEEDGAQSAEVEEDLEGSVSLKKVSARQEASRQNKMPGRGNRKKLSEPLNYSQNEKDENGDHHQDSSGIEELFVLGRMSP